MFPSEFVTKGIASAGKLYWLCASPRLVEIARAEKTYMKQVSKNVKHFNFL